MTLEEILARQGLTPEAAEEAAREMAEHHLILTGEDRETLDGLAELRREKERLAAENQKLRVDGTLERGLREAGALDWGYMAYKIREKGEPQMDEDGKILGWEETVQELKKQYPQQFAQSRPRVLVNRLEKKAESHSLTRKEILRQSYQERARLYASDPEGYTAAMQE